MAEEFKESKDNPLHKDYGVWSNTKYLLGKMRKHSPGLIATVILGIICSAVQTLCWGVFGKYIIDLIQLDADYDTKLHKLIILLIIFTVILVITMCGNNYVSHNVFFKFIDVRMHVIRERVDKAMSINYEYLERPATLDIEQRAQQATGGNNEGIEGMMHLMQTLGNALAVVIASFVAVLVVDFRLVIALIVISIFQFLFYKLIIKLDKKNVWDALSPVWRRTSYMRRVTQDFEAGKDIRLFNMTEFLIGKERDTFKIREDKYVLHNRYWIYHHFVSQFLYLVGHAAIIYVLYKAVLGDTMSIGNFTMYVGFATAFSTNLLQFMHRSGDYVKASVETDDLRSFIDLKVEEDTEYEPIPETTEYEFVFHNVGYKYYKAEKWALRGLNLTIRPHEKLAVVGLNGAGKTTMIKLLLRLYDVTEGSITLNGIDIRKFDRNEYYKLFSPVFQDLKIFAFNVNGNVSMKSVDDTDKERVMAAIEEAGLLEKIDSLDKGAETELLKVVDENGVDLSGGEKQKLALARALYKSAPIVVLDEPTSALDAIAEQNLYERFEKMIGEKSAVYISHRLASTKFCDNIAMFKDGEMVEYGSHDELMEKDGEYASMFNIQAQYYVEDGEDAQCGEGTKGTEDAQGADDVKGTEDAQGTSNDKNEEVNA